MYHYIAYSTERPNVELIYFIIIHFESDLVHWDDCHPERKIFVWECSEIELNVHELLEEKLS